jgi:hypothetical protein
VRHDPQEYDVTDLYNELVDDCNFESFLNFLEKEPIDWPGAYAAREWNGSVTDQFVKWICGSHDYMVEDVLEIVTRDSSGAMRALVEADNHGFMKTKADAERAFELINCLEAEKVI